MRHCLDSDKNHFIIFSACVIFHGNGRQFLDDIVKSFVCRKYKSDCVVDNSVKFFVAVVSQSPDMVPEKTMAQ